MTVLSIPETLDAQAAAAVHKSDALRSPRRFLVSGMLAGWLLLGERLDLDSLLACALVFVGLAITLLPASLLRRFAWPVRRLG